MPVSLSPTSSHARTIPMISNAISRLLTSPAARMQIWNDGDKAPSSKLRRFPAAAGYAIFLWLPLLLLFGLWRPWGVPVAQLLSIVLGIAGLCHIGWASVRRRRLARQERAAAVNPMSGIALAGCQAGEVLYLPNFHECGDEVVHQGFRCTPVIDPRHRCAIK